MSTETRVEYVIVHVWSDGSKTETRVSRRDEGTIAVEGESESLWFASATTAREVANAMLALAAQEETDGS